MRTPLAVILALLAVLIPLAYVTDGADEAAPAAARPAAPVDVIAARVERLRGLRFKTLPEPVGVTPQMAVEEGLADLDRSYPAAARRADEALYTLLGLLPPQTDLRDVTASIFGEGVGGYYDPRTKRLRIVEGPNTANRVLEEIVVAHELTHALEDQRFGLDLGSAEQSGDVGYAYRALVEGTATALMLEYLGTQFRGEEAIAGLLSSVFAVSASEPLPPFVEAGLTWPYLGGQEFVSELYQRAGGSWKLVDIALRARPPASTEQVLHPEKWLRVELPDRVRLDRGPGQGWRRLTAGTFGEWQTAQLVGDDRAAAGWGGDRYALWRRGDGECATPCRDRDALVIRWRWDTERDAEEFVDAVESADLPEGYSLARAGVDVTLAYGPEGLAEQLVGSPRR